MKIYAVEGHKVTCVSNKDVWTNELIQELELNKVYTVLRTDVSGWYTDVWLKEIPDKSFNSVLFEDLKSQSKTLRQKRNLSTNKK